MWWPKWRDCPTLFPVSNFNRTPLGVFTEPLLDCMPLGEGDVDKLGLSLRKLISELHDPQTERGGQESLDSGAPPVPVTMDLTQENTRAGSSGPRPTYSLTFHRKEFFFFPVCIVITFFPMYLYNTSNLSHFLEAYKPIPYYPLSYVGIRAHKPCWHSSFYCFELTHISVELQEHVRVCAG